MKALMSLVSIESYRCRIWTLGSIIDMFLKFTVFVCYFRFGMFKLVVHMSDQDPPGHVQQGENPKVRPRTRWKDHTSHLIQEYNLSLQLGQRFQRSMLTANAAVYLM